MDALLQSFALVVASEMGDKTQLLALVLALRFRQPFIVMAGILLATLLNHGLATLVGGWVGSHIDPSSLRYGLAAIFMVFGAWILVPDKLVEDDEAAGTKRYGNAFFTTVVLFFLAEMGDKTQLATVALSAKFQSPVEVTLGTTLGMMVADGLAVVFGERLTKIVPMQAIRILSAVLFAGFGIGILFAGMP